MKLTINEIDEKVNFVRERNGRDEYYSVKLKHIDNMCTANFGIKDESWRILINNAIEFIYGIEYDTMITDYKSLYAAWLKT